MAKRIRVYDLAKSLGLSNKGAFDLCNDLGMGIKSPSSSIEEAQADRARRKIERDGFGGYERAGGEESHSHGRPSGHSGGSRGHGEATPEAPAAEAKRIETTTPSATASSAPSAEAQPVTTERPRVVKAEEPTSDAPVASTPRHGKADAQVAPTEQAPSFATSEATASTSPSTPTQPVSSSQSSTPAQPSASSQVDPPSDAAPQQALRDFSQSQDFSRTTPSGNRRVVRYGEGRSSAPKEGRNETTSDSAPSLENAEQPTPPNRPRVPLSLSGKPIPPPPGGGFNRGPRPDGQGGQGNYQDRGQRQGGYQDRGQGGYNRGPRPEGQGGGQGGYQDRGQGGYNRGPRPDGQGGGQGGQGGFNRGPRPEGQGGQGGFNRGPRPEGQGGQGGYNRGPRPEGQGGQGGFNRGPRPEGQGGFNRGPRPEGQGGQGGFNRGPRPEGQSGQGGFNRGPRPDGQGGQGGFNRGPRPEGQGGQGGFNRGPRTDGPGGQGGGFASRGGSSFGGARGSTPPPPPAGAPFGLKGGPQRGSRPVSKSARRRSKKTNEELEPTQVANYVPSNAPVPDGEVIVERGSTAQEIGPKFNRSAGDVVRFLFLQGELVTATQSLSDDAIELFAAEIGAAVKLVDPGQEQEAELYAKYFSADDVISDDDIEWRAPVVTVMGHVDHGKTKLLDRIRETNVVAKEAGGITQHIGAYRAMVDDRFVTFIDTPGHEAFTQMRARGAGVTDIVVLVVAADDGVMPQTLEAIDHAKAAKVPIVVAINKIDKADADPTRVMQQLSEHGLVPEQWGGDTITVEVSALQNLGVDDLLEHLVVLAEVLELKASKTGKAKGVVLEANLDPGRGPVATVIVQQGTLHVGDPLVAGVAFGRVKALIDEAGRPVKEAEPSTPVQVLGFSEVPSAGDEFRETDELSVARQIGSMREQRQRIAGYTAQPGSAPGAKLEDLFEQIKRGETATLNVIIKADVQGSLEAVTESLRKLERPEVRLSIVRRAVGGINENDISLGAASNALIIGFNVRPDRRAREAAEAQHVEIRTYEIIYKMLEDIEAAMVGILAPEYEEVVTGEAEVREIFRVPKVGAVAGCYVQSGVITRGSKVRFLREGVVIWKGSITSLRRFKDDVREVASGFECGIGLSDFQDLRSGDTIETFEDREIPRS